MKDNKPYKSDDEVENIFSGYIKLNLKGYALNYIEKQDRQYQREDLRAELEDVEIGTIEMNGTDFFIAENKDYSFMIEMFENDSLAKLFKQFPEETVQIIFLKILDECI